MKNKFAYAGNHVAVVTYHCTISNANTGIYVVWVSCLQIASLDRCIHFIFILGFPEYFHHNKVPDNTLRQAGVFTVFTVLTSVFI